MEYKLYIDGLDIQVKEAIQWLLDDNIDSLSIYEGLEIDTNYEDEEEVF